MKLLKKNRNNESIKYAHVGSVNIFTLIDKILNQSRNNPIFQFEKHNDIEGWLKMQWSGLFQELIRKRKSDADISELSKEVKELSNINTTLKRYLEEIVIKSDTSKGNELIEEEEKRLSDSRKMNEFAELAIIKGLVTKRKIPAQEIADVLSTSKNFKQIAEKFALIIGEKDNGKRLFEYWKDSPDVVKDFNYARNTISLPDLPLE